MRNASTFDRLVLCGLALFVITTFLASCIAGATTTFGAKAIRSTRKAGNVITLFALGGARVAADIISRSFRGNQEEGVS